MKLLTALAWLLLPAAGIVVMELDKWRGRRADRRQLAPVLEQERFVDTLGRICGVR